VRELLLASEDAFGERVEKAAELEPAHHRAELRAGYFSPADPLRWTPAARDPARIVAERRRRIRAAAGRSP
jgi:hypothetical protein